MEMELPDSEPLTLPETIGVYGSLRMKPGPTLTMPTVPPERMALPDGEPVKTSEPPDVIFEEPLEKIYTEPLDVYVGLTVKVPLPAVMPPLVTGLGVNTVGATAIGGKGSGGSRRNRSE